MRPDEMPDLPMSEAHHTGFGASKDEMRRGFKRSYEPTDFMSENNGDTYVGDRATFGGVVGRPNGWER